MLLEYMYSDFFHFIMSEVEHIYMYLGDFDMPSPVFVFNT